MSEELFNNIESCLANDELDGTDWWKYVIIYQIYPRSFQDTNGDGIGDIQGIISRLDYFVYLNIGAIWISPIYKSPMVDHGYDISDYKDIDPVFGTLKDFDQLINEAHKRKIKVIMDFVSSHTSNQHPWFIESSNRTDENACNDFYIWKDGKNNVIDGSIEPPNNWISLFGGPAWTWSEKRNQFYMHTFAVEQPDLNYRNVKVLRKMKGVLKFWLDRGVDGFRMDAVVHLVKHEDFLDEPRSRREDVSGDHPDFLDHVYTSCQPEVHEIMKAFRRVFKRYYYRTGKYIFMAAEVYQEHESMKFYNSGSDIPLNLSLTTLKGKLSGLVLKDFVAPWLEMQKVNKWPNFVLGNHDQPRLLSRIGEEYVDAMNVLLLLLPGTPTTYYGEEIGMVNIDVQHGDTQDPLAKNLGSNTSELVSRDACRSPMQWDDTPNAGFSTAKTTWLPIHPAFKTRNVKNQMLDGPGSHINIYRAASLLRREDVFKDGLLEFSIVNENVFSFWRYNPLSRGCDRGSCYLVTLNIGDEAVSCDYSTEYSKQGIVILDTKVPERAGFTTSLDAVDLDRGQCIVIDILFSL